MPRNQFQRMVFAFLTVLVTVHGYVFYSLYVVNGNTLMQINGADSVIHAINTQGGVYMFGRMVPIWAFGKLFAKDIAARNSTEMPERPQNEKEAIADIFRRMDEIQKDLAHERRQRKKLAEQITNRDYSK